MQEPHMWGINGMTEAYLLSHTCNMSRNDLSKAMSALDADAGISAIVLTGSEKAFAAGADIKEMAPKSYMDNFLVI